MNSYVVYRFIFLTLTLLAAMVMVVNLLQYKKLYDKLPGFVREYLGKRSMNIVAQKLQANPQDLILNLFLLLILVSLNLILWFVL